MKKAFLAALLCLAFPGSALAGPAPIPQTCDDYTHRIQFWGDSVTVEYCSDEGGCGDAQTFERDRHRNTYGGGRLVDRRRDKSPAVIFENTRIPCS